MAPFSLHLRALWVRLITSIFSLLDRYAYGPKTTQPTLKISIPSTISRQSGTIPLIFYTPPSSSPSTIPRPVIINFHGGGWVFGSPQMDARWAAAVVKTGTVLISVGYRLAPKHPYPTPIEDCVDAIKWIYAHADDYYLDKSRICLSGFSAGGNMVFASAMMLHAQPGNEIKLAAIVSFYPLLDRTHSREAKYKRNPIAAEKVSTPKRWDKLFVDCYLGSGPVDLGSKYLSPGLAEDELLSQALPESIQIFTCMWDALCEEGEVFKKRLAVLGKRVGGSTVEGVNHAFDRIPAKNGNLKMDEMYSEALNGLKDVLS
jgi:acetyl esterase/lipase